ncbi:MAG: Response regulator [Blastococcus sp.]|nr:Response regulator [Blastococcus sp.]
MTAFTDLRPQRVAPGAPILLVDDEQAILDGLSRQLRKKFTVHTATGGAEALELLESEPVAVVVSDMRMPQMNGATFLSKVRTLYPDIVRILLTGQADTQAAITAVNEGQIYRFLTKPCPPEVLLEEIGSAVEVNRLVTVERELLSTTLRRTVEALTTTLSLAQPLAFARAVRITRVVTELAQALQLEDPWEVEVTAMLAQLGAVTLPPTVLEKLDAGRPLDEDERDMAVRVPVVSRDLVAAIPRLETVAAAIGWQTARYDGRGSAAGMPAGEELPLAARMLRLATDYETGISQRSALQDTINALRADAGAYDPRLLDALIGGHEVTELEAPPRMVRVHELEEGMVVFDDILTTEGILLIGHGTVVTDSLIQRLENYSEQGRVDGALRVTG